jgi:hypothetical protein
MMAAAAAAAGATRQPISAARNRSNDTHCSTTDPDARLYRKGPGMEARLCFIGHGRSRLRRRTRVPSSTACQEMDIL